MFTCVHSPRDDGAVRGTAKQEAAARAEAAAVDAVSVTRERGEGKLREVSCAVDTKCFIDGAGGEQGRREGNAAQFIGVVLESSK